MAYKSGARAGACDVDREPASFAMRQYVLLPSLVRVAPETKPKSEWGSADRRELRERNFNSGELLGSPWQNCFAERLIGSIRCECRDHVVVLGEQHLREVLKCYASYYNTARTHRSLAKDAPLTRPIHRIGRIVSHALVGGLHHQYVRI
jgi:Integrase core domain